MNSSFPDFLNWLVLVAGTYGLIVVFGGNLRPEVKAHISHWLSGNAAPRPWADLVAMQFDTFFGKDRLGSRFVTRSALISMSSAAILLLIFNGDDLIQLTSDVEMNPTRRAVFGLVIPYLVINLAVVCNVVPDYLSLVETRLLLGYMQCASRLNMTLLLVLDFLLTGLLFSWSLMVWLVIFQINIISGWGVTARHFLNPVGFYRELFTKIEWSFDIVAPLILTTYITSVWLWLIALGAVVIRYLSRFSSFFNAENKPIETIATAASLSVGVGALILNVIWNLITLMLNVIWNLINS